jgi:hypothetical protein
MYEGLTSRALRKDALPAHLLDPTDLQLLATERTSDAGAFSYLLRLRGPDHYLILLKFIEVLTS